MNDNLESLNDRYSEVESRVLDGTEFSDDWKDEFTIKSKKKFFSTNDIEKKSSPKKIHEYDIVDYLIFYLILFSSIGLSTIIIMGAT